MPNIKRLTAEDFNGANFAPQILAMAFFFECDAEGNPVTIIAAAAPEWADAVDAVVNPQEEPFVGEDHPRYEAWRDEVAQGDTLLGLADWLAAGEVLDG